MRQSPSGDEIRLVEQSRCRHEDVTGRHHHRDPFAAAVDSRQVDQSTEEDMNMLRHLAFAEQQGSPGTVLHPRVLEQPLARRFRNEGQKRNIRHALRQPLRSPTAVQKLFRHPFASAIPLGELVALASPERESPLRTQPAQEKSATDGFSSRCIGVSEGVGDFILSICVRNQQPGCLMRVLSWHHKFSSLA